MNDPDELCMAINEMPAAELVTPKESFAPAWFWVEKYPFSCASPV